MLALGPLIAMFWEASWPLPVLAWPVIIAACLIVNGAVITARKKRGETRTAMMLFVSAIRTCVGITVLLLSLAATMSNALDFRLLFITFFALVAVAHCASSIILRWAVQFVAALVWWGAAIAAFLLPATDLHILAAAALLLGNVGFGAWLTHREWSQRDE